MSFTSGSIYRTPLMLCGSKPSHSYVSEGPYLHIEFHSDTEKQAKGFSILVEYLMTGGKRNIYIYL